MPDWRSLGFITPEESWKTFSTASTWGATYRISFHYPGPPPQGSLTKIVVREAFGTSPNAIEYTTRSQVVYPKPEYSIVELANPTTEQVLAHLNRYIQILRLFKRLRWGGVIIDAAYEVGIEELEQVTEPTNQQLDRVEDKIDRLLG